MKCPQLSARGGAAPTGQEEGCEEERWALAAPVPPTRSASPPGAMCGGRAGGTLPVSFVRAR